MNGSIMCILNLYEVLYNQIEYGNVSWTSDIGKNITLYNPVMQKILPEGTLHEILSMGIQTIAWKWLIEWILVNGCDAR